MEYLRIANKQIRSILVALACSLATAISLGQSSLNWKTLSQSMLILWPVWQPMAASRTFAGIEPKLPSLLIRGSWQLKANGP